MQDLVFAPPKGGRSDTIFPALFSYSKKMEKLIQEAIDKKKIKVTDGKRIQKNIDDVDFASPREKEKAIIVSIKYVARALTFPNRIIKLALREDKK